jgi:hypothetical protein
MTLKFTIHLNPKFLTFFFIIFFICLNKQETVFANFLNGFTGNPYVNSNNLVGIRAEANHKAYATFTFTDYVEGYHKLDTAAGISMQELDPSDPYHPNRYYFIQLKNPDNELFITKINNYIRKEAQKYLDRGEFFAVVPSEFALHSYNTYVSRLLNAEKYRVTVHFQTSHRFVTFNGAGDVLTLDDIFKVSKEKYSERMFELCYDAVVGLNDHDLDRLEYRHILKDSRIYQYELERYKDDPSYDERLKELKYRMLSGVNSCIQDDEWIIGTDSITLVFYTNKTSNYFEIPFTELSDMLEDGYV